MTDYTKTTNFTAKDTLPTGDPNKVIQGAQHDTEYDNIATAIATKADIAGPTFTGTVTLPAVDVTGAIDITSTFNIDGVEVTASATELNLLDGLAGVVAKDSATGAGNLPVGTTAQRPGTPSSGMIRFNSTDTAFEGYDGSEWGALGGGALTMEFTADGAITAGEAVALQSDGTVKAVGTGATGDTFGTAVESDSSSNSISRFSMCVDEANGKIVVAYYDATDYDIYARVGTISGSSISWGTAVLVSGGANLKFICDVSFNVDDGKVVLTYSDVTAVETYTVLGTISGSSITFGGATAWGLYISAGGFCSEYDPDSGEVIAAYDDGTNLDCRCISSSGATATLNTAAQVEATMSPRTYIDMVYDATAARMMILWVDDDDSDRGQVAAVAVSGTTCTPGSSVSLETTSNYPAIAYDATEGKTLVTYVRASTEIKVSVLSISGSVITVNTAVTVSFNCNAYAAVGVGGVLWLFGNDNGNSDYGTYFSGTISGTTTTSWTDRGAFDSNATNFVNPMCIYDSVSSQIIVAYTRTSGTAALYLTLYTPASTGTNAADFIGFSQDTVGDTATLTVDPLYTVNSNQSGLTFNADYWLEDDGTLSGSDTGNPKAGRAITATQIQVGA